MSSIFSASACRLPRGSTRSTCVGMRLPAGPRNCTLRSQYSPLRMSKFADARTPYLNRYEAAARYSHSSSPSYAALTSEFGSMPTITVLSDVPNGSVFFVALYDDLNCQLLP